MRATPPAFQAGTKKKFIALLLIYQSARARHHLLSILFKTDLHWGTENKEQSQVRKPRVTLPQYLVGDSHERQAWRVGHH
jgi:hypothetical protein